MPDIDIHICLKAWFINMGYPRDRIPPDWKFKELCRGKYANVFEGIMKVVKAKHEVDRMRQQLFVHDMKDVIKNAQCIKKIPVQEPESYILWKEKKRLIEELNLAEKQFKNKENIVTSKCQSVKAQAVSRLDFERKTKNEKRKIHLVKNKTFEFKRELKQLDTMCNMASTFDSNRNGWDENKPNPSRKYRRNPENIINDCLHMINQFGKVKSRDSQDTTSAVITKKNDITIQSNASIISNIKYPEATNSSTTDLNEHNNVDDAQRLELYNYLDANMNGLNGYDVWPVLRARQDSTIKIMRDIASGNITERNVVLPRMSPTSTISKIYIIHSNLALETLVYKEHCKKDELELLNMCTAFFPENSEAEDHDSPRTLFTLRLEQIELETTLEVCQEEQFELRKRLGLYQLANAGTSLPNASSSESVDTLRNEINELDTLCLKKKVEIEKAISKLHSFGPKLEFVYRKINALSDTLNSVSLCRPRPAPSKVSTTVTSESGFETNSSYEDFVNDLQEGPVAKSSAIPAVLRSYMGDKSKDMVKIQSATMDLSFMKELDSEENISDDISEPAIATFTGELKYFNKIFPLEKNRKLCDASGRTIWMKDTLIGGLKELASIATAGRYIFNPLLTPASALDKVEEQLKWLNALKSIQENICDDDDESHIEFDLLPLVESSEARINVMKKKLTEVENLLKKINLRTEMINRPIVFWSSGQIQNYIASSRTVAGRTFREYQSEYEAMLGGKYDCPF